MQSRGDFGTYDRGELYQSSVEYKADIPQETTRLRTTNIERSMLHNLAHNVLTSAQVLFGTIRSIAGLGFVQLHTNQFSGRHTPQ